jgi:hypothetical protein
MADQPQANISEEQAAQIAVEATAAPVNANPVKEVPAGEVADNEAVALAAAANGAKKTGFEVPASTIVHLLGVATQNDLSVMESKLDMLISRVATLSMKVDRLVNQLTTISNEFYVDRIDFQLSDIRQMMKKVFPSALSSPELLAKEAIAKKNAARENPEPVKEANSGNGESPAQG